MSKDINCNFIDELAAVHITGRNAEEPIMQLESPRESKVKD